MLTKFKKLSLEWMVNVKEERIERQAMIFNVQKYSSRMVLTESAIVFFKDVRALSVVPTQKGSSVNLKSFKGKCLYRLWCMCDACPLGIHYIDEHETRAMIFIVMAVKNVNACPNEHQYRFHYDDSQS